MARYAVVGSNSFSGGHCVDALLAAGHEVLGLSRSPEKSAVFLPYRSRNSAAFRFERVDLNGPAEAVTGLLDKFRPECVINFAAQGEVATSWKYPDQWFETNAVGVVKLANGLKGRDYLRRFVEISTPEVYGSCEDEATESAPLNPSTPYAASKAAGDLFLQTLFKQYKFPVVFTRTTNVYGPHQQLYRIIPRTMISIRKKVRVPLHGGGRAMKAYLHIADAIAGILAAAGKGRDGNVYHFSPDNDIAVRDLVARICTISGVDFEAAAEIVGERPGQDARYHLSSRKAREELGWAPRKGLDDGLREVSAWIDRDWDAISRETVEYVHQK